MSHWQQLLDLEGQVLNQSSAPAAQVRLPEDLQGPTLLISDFASAPFGVDTLPAHSKRLAPLLEKRLREQGEIDGLAQVLVHTSEQQGNIARGILYSRTRDSAFTLPAARSKSYRKSTVISAS